MKPILLIVFPFLFISCSTVNQYLEVTKPFKNYTEHISPFLPLKSNDNIVYKIWLFESTSIDRLLIIYKENGTYKSELIEFGEVYSKKNKKEVFKSSILTPKNSNNKIVEFLEEELKQLNLKDFEFSEIANEEPILNYLFEWKENSGNISIKKITIPKSEKNSLNLIKHLKSEYNIK